MLHAVPSGTIHHPAPVPRGAGTALMCHGQLVAPGSQNSRCGHNSSPPKPSEALESSREWDGDTGLCSPKSYFRIPQTLNFPLISTNPNRTHPKPHFFPFIPPNPKQAAEMKHFWTERMEYFHLEGTCMDHLHTALQTDLSRGCPGNLCQARPPLSSQK